MVGVNVDKKKGKNKMNDRTNKNVWGYASDRDDRKNRMTKEKWLEGQKKDVYIPKKIKVKKLHPDAVLPKYQTSGSVGFDFHSVENFVILPMSQQVVPTGWAMEIPSGFELQIRPRSGLSFKHQITITNSPGTIDQDYRNEIMIILFNLGNTSFHIKKGDRIAQGVVCPISQFCFEIVDELDKTERNGGLGSTGI